MGGALIMLRRFECEISISYSQWNAMLVYGNIHENQSLTVPPMLGPSFAPITSSLSERISELS
jgi:hypothetical protein